MAEEQATSLDKLEAAHDAAVGAQVTPPEESAEAKPEEKAEEVKEEVKEEKKEVKPDPEDNRERSQLGRKVKLLEDTLSAISSKIDQLVTQKPDPEPEFEDDVPITKKELAKYLSQQAEKQTQDRQTYVNEYLRHEAVLGMNMEDAEYGEVVEERLKNFDVRHSNNAKADAELNFAKAQAAVLKRKLSGLGKKANPLKGEKPSGPLGGPVETKNQEHAKKVVRLDEHAASFAKSMGLSDDKVQKYLAGE